MPEPVGVVPPSSTCDTAAPAFAPIAASATDAHVVHSEVPPELIQRSLRNSMKDAAFWAIMQGAGASYLTPFVILGGTGLFSIAAFYGLPFIAGALVQWLAANVTDRAARRNAVLIPSAFVQALTWAPIAAAIFLEARLAYGVMLVGFIANYCLGAFGTPAWQSLMGTWFRRSDADGTSDCATRWAAASSWPPFLRLAGG